MPDAIPCPPKSSPYTATFSCAPEFRFRVDSTRSKVAQLPGNLLQILTMVGCHNHYVDSSV